VQCYKKVDKRHLLITYDDKTDVGKVIKACKHSNSDEIELIHSL
jgi:hypothetical protein